MTSRYPIIPKTIQGRKRGVRAGLRPRLDAPVHRTRSFPSSCSTASSLDVIPRKAQGVVLPLRWTIPGSSS